MTLSKLELRVLIEISSGAKKLDDLVKALKMSLSRVSILTSRLKEKQLINKEKHGQTIELSMSTSAPAQAFRKLLVQRKPYKLDEFLFSLRFRILSSCLYEEKTTAEIAQMTNASKKSIQNIIYPLVSRLMLRREKRNYIFQERAWPLLFEFLDSHRNFYHIGDVLYKFEDEVVFETREERSGNLTGFNAYGQYGVQVRTVRYCYYTGKLNIDKIFLHSLMQVEDPRTLGLALVFFKKNNLSKVKLLRIAPRYDLKKKMQDFISILENKLNTETLPLTSQKEIQDMMKLYDVR